MKHEVEDLQQEEAVTAAKLRPDHEVEDLQHEKTFSTSQKKREQKDVQNKETPASTRSRVEDEVEDLQYEDTVAIAIPKVKPKELQHEELQHKETRVEIETKNLLDKEAVASTKSQIENKAKDLLDEKALATLRPNIKNRLKKLKDKVANANVGLRDKHEAGKSLNKEESTATTKTKDKPNEKTPGTAEKREQQVTNLHQDVTHPLSKTSVESEVKSEPAREKHKLKDVQPQISITKKRKDETSKGTTNSIDSPPIICGQILKQLETLTMQTSWPNQRLQRPPKILPWLKLLVRLCQLRTFRWHAKSPWKQNQASR